MTRLYVNELSPYRQPVAERIVYDTAKTFLQGVAFLRQIDRKIELFSPNGINNLEVAPGVTLATLRRVPDLRDYVLLLRRVRERSSSYPPVTKMQTTDGFPVEYMFMNETAVGLGLAHLDQQIALSLPTSPVLSSSFLRGRRYVLGCDQYVGDQDSWQSVCVRHGCDENTAKVHLDWVYENIKSRMYDGQSILREVEETLRYVRVAPGAKKELEAWEHGHSWKRALSDRLIELERTMRISPKGRTPRQADFPSKVTRESKSREHLCWLKDIDGETRLFSLHQRMTPGAGRVHFRIDVEAHCIVVGYVGKKLGS